MNRKEPIGIYWSRLIPSGNSFYARECPFCREGILPVTRNRETFQLEEIDFCLNCGQPVKYLDIEELRKDPQR